MPLMAGGSRVLTGTWQIFLGLALLLASLTLRAGDASMTLYVFKRGLPQPNVEVLLDDWVIGFTDAHGVVELSIPPGLHELELRDQDLVVLEQQVLATDDEVSQWIVNITRGLSSLVDVESTAVFGVQAGEPEVQAQATGGTGVLAIRLLSAEDGKPIEGARVFISGQARDLRTDANGSLEVELPAGAYSVSALHARFNTFSRDGLEVAEGGRAELEYELSPSGSELPEFVVIEPFIAGSLASVLEERRTEVAVANILGAEQISKSGDSTAASALRRVTGLTLVDGRFIYVRGLGERYSSTLLNGASVPSPDPTRRVVPLDLFPAGIIDSIAVKKGYTSDLPGEFGGGAVELRTRQVPESPFLDIEIGAAFRSGTSFEEGLGYKGSSSDWTGYDGGIRQVPDELAELIGDGSRLQPFNRFTGVGFTAGELETAGDSLSVIYDAHAKDVPLNLEGGLTGGYVWEFDNQTRLGFLAAMEYQDDWLNVSQQRVQYTVGGGELQPQNEFRFEQTFRNIDFSSFINLGAEFGENHKLGYNWMLLRNTSDRTQVEQGTNPDVEGDIRFVELEWIERELASNQVLGEHVIPGAGGLKLNWQYTNADASSETPDNRRYRYDPDVRTAADDDFIFSQRNDGNQRRWSRLADSSKSWNIDFLQPLEMFESVDIAVLTGFSRADRNRDSELRRFSFFCRGSSCRTLDLLRQPSLEDIINPDTIFPQGWQLEEVTNSTDSYTGSQVIDAWHVGFDLDFGSVWRLAGGFRDETSDLTTTTFNQFNPNNTEIVTEQATDDIFPYLTATWIQGDHQLRAGYGETINRPDFKELSPSQYKDPILDKVVQGNPNLLPAFLTHYDLRWDYYFSPGEFISLGVFYKEFETPIENVILAAAGDSLITFANAETAENSGIEFELYKNLDVLDKWWDWGAYWERFYINTNYAWIDSEISLADDSSTIQTTDQRPLQGQSPYVLNFQIGYEDPDRELNTALLFNQFGERIVEVGVQGAPDIYEQPRASLDLVYSQGFGDWKLKAAIKNILDPEIELTQGNQLTRQVEGIGREFSVGVQYSF